MQKEDSKRRTPCLRFHSVLRLRMYSVRSSSSIMSREVLMPAYFAVFTGKVQRRGKQRRLSISKREKILFIYLWYS